MTVKLSPFPLPASTKKRRSLAIVKSFGRELRHRDDAYYVAGMVPMPTAHREQTQTTAERRASIGYDGEMSRRVLDDNLIELLGVLPGGWKLESYCRSTHGWNAKLYFKDREFLLVSEWDYIRVAQRIVTMHSKGKKRPTWVDIQPPDDQRRSNSALQVRQILMNAVEQPLP